MEAPPHSEWASFPTGSLIVDTQLGPTVLVEDFGTERMSKTGVEQGTSVQDFLVGKRVITIDLERRLRCLSLKPALRFTAMFSSLYASQIIQGITGSTSISASIPTEGMSIVESCSVLAVEEDVERAMAHRDAGGRADTFLVG